MQEEPSALKLLRRKKLQFLYSAVILILASAIFLYAHGRLSGAPQGRQNFRLAMAIIWISVLLLIRVGYELIARATFMAALFMGFWFVLTIQHEYIVGCVGASLTTFVLVPLIYHFDKRGLNIACVSMIVGSCSFLAISRIYFPVTTDIVLTPADINRGLFAMLTSITLGILTIMNFSSVSQHLYEDLQELNRRLESNTKEKEAFFATVSHEIRNPIQALLGSVELLQDDDMQQTTKASLIEICKNCSETVLNLVSNILDVSKIAADKMQLCPVPANLREVLSRVLRISQARARAKNISLRLINDPALPPTIEFDTQRVEQIVLNLVSNAIKFTSSGKVIVRLRWLPSPDADPTPLVREALACSSWKETIVFNERESGCNVGLQKKYTKDGLPSAKDRTVLGSYAESGGLDSRPGSHQSCGVAKIEIMDTGIGISKENAQKLFRAYQQADASISRNYGGTGLGLWISKSILVQMHGDIRVKSKVGRGSDFILAFPTRVCDEVAAFSDLSDESKCSEQFRDKMCLLLDDIPENLFLLKELLRRHGAKTLCKQKGTDALEEYKTRGDIDIIITDLRMPIMSGQEFIIEVREYENQSKRPRVPIVVVTAENSSEEKKLCLATYGADEYVVKPVKYKDLVTAIGRLLAGGKKIKPKRVLIVDDDVVSAGFLAAMLKKEGHLCVVRNSVREASADFAANFGGGYDAILLDNLLGDGSGPEFLAYAVSLAAANRTAMPFVVSMSGNTVAEQRDTYRDLTVNQYLQKPIKKQDLLEVMQIVQCQDQDSTSFDNYYIDG